jgi:hypothetical protein
MQDLVKSKRGYQKAVDEGRPARVWYETILETIEKMEKIVH